MRRPDAIGSWCARVLDFLLVIRNRGKVRKLKLVVEGEVRGRVGRVDRARFAEVERDALSLEAYRRRAGAFVARGLRPRAVVFSHGAR